MCEVEVGTKDPKTGEIKMIPKLVPGCQTPAKDGTVLVTDSPKVKEHQRMIMEYLLLNHPLDCPVCDQAGECGLQDYSYEYGQADHRFVERADRQPAQGRLGRRSSSTDRCIMCTRCVRFTREITQTAELKVMRRGNHAEIDIFPGHPVDNTLAGNVVDLCPVGALLNKDFLHKQRVWFLSKHDAICTRCSTGCNISAEENRGQLWRFKPRFNPHVNDYWICDEGRCSYKPPTIPTCSPRCTSAQEATSSPSPVDEALSAVAGGLAQDRRGRRGRGRRPLAVPDRRGGLPHGHLPQGPQPGQRAGARAGPGPGEDQTFTPDQTRGGPATPASSSPGRSRSTPRSARTAAASRRSSSTSRARSSLRRPPLAASIAGEFAGLYVASDSHRPLDRRRPAQALRSQVEFLVVQDTLVDARWRTWPTWSWPAATFAEKAGCYVNADGRLQYAEAALPPRDGALPDLDLFAILLGRPGGPVRSREVLAELAAAVPAFAVAEGGMVPAFGVLLGEARAGRGRGLGGTLLRPLDAAALRQGGPARRAVSEGGADA